MSNAQIIKNLQDAGLIAACSHCGAEFDLASSLLFDGLGKFPDLAEQKKRMLLSELKERMETLQLRKISASAAEQKAIQVGIGKIIEKVLPAYKGFNMDIPDCRTLFEPIDLIVFNGVSKMRVDSITFLEIKTGEARLNKHEKAIQHAIDDKKVRYEEV